jgi:hypothetical protein
MKIKLEEFEGKDFAPDSHKGRIAELIKKLSYYKNAPIAELNEALAELQVIEKQCQDVDASHGGSKTEYIIEILAALQEEEKKNKGQFRSHLENDEESVFWRMVMIFKEKIKKVYRK